MTGLKPSLSEEILLIVRMIYITLFEYKSSIGSDINDVMPSLPWDKYRSDMSDSRSKRFSIVFLSDAML